MSPERLAAHWQVVREAAERHERDPDALLLHAGVSRSGGRPLVEMVEEYAALGVDHLHLSAVRDDERSTMGELERLSKEVLSAIR
jgi:hypothetical protein